MKITLWLLLIALFPVVLPAQSRQDFTAVDAHARSVKNIPDPAALSAKLTSGYTTETEKVRAIYVWVCENTAYDVNGFRNPKLYQSLWSSKEKDSITAAAKFQQSVAKYVIKEHKAVCFGYATLFKTLCEYAGIKAEVIDGYGRNGSHVVGQPFKANHSWNAVQVDNKWYLLDATWGAGLTNENITSYKKHFNEGFFLSSPQDFILDHYPVDSKWALLDAPPTLEEFFSSPLVYPSFKFYNLGLITPHEGILEAKQGDKIRFEITTSEEDPMFGVFDNVTTSDNKIPLDQLKIYTRPDPSNKNILVFEYEVKTKRAQELYMVYNMESVVKYKIKVKG